MSKNETIYGADGKPMYEFVNKERSIQCMSWVNVYGSLPLLRVGFLSPVPPRHAGDGAYIHDSRPIAWPIFHPYWIVRMSLDANMLMAYVESVDDIKTFWPEATEITVFEEGVTKYGFNGNFPKPAWLDEVHADGFEVKPPRCGVWRVVNEETEQSLIGYSEDCDYAVQLNNHQLEYGVHEDKEFQDNYTGWQNLRIEFRPTRTLELAKKLAEQLRDFDESPDTGMETNLNMED